MKKYILLLLSTFISMVLYAQSSVQGKILDDTNQAISYATVRLLQADSVFISGVASDSSGIYSFKNIIAGNYLLAISSIGYESVVIPVNVQKNDIQMDPIYLKTGSIALGEVEIKAQAFIRQEDRVLIIPDKSQVKHANTGYDLLNNLMIPSINVDRRNGKVTTFGGDVALYIDGRKVDYREIQSLRPRDIEKVEYIDIPTGKYSNDPASINYITKKYKNGGYVSFDAMQTLGYLNGDYNVTSKVSHGNTSYTLFAGHTMEKYNSHGEKQDHILFPDYSISRNYTIDKAQNKHDQQYAQFNIENRNDKRTLMAKATLVHNNDPDNFNNATLTYSGHYNQKVSSKETTDQNGLKPSLTLYSNFNIKENQTLEVSMNGDYTKNNYDRYYTENEEETNTNTIEDLYTVLASANYNLQLKNKNNFGVQLLHSQTFSTVNYEGSNQTSQDLKNGETLLFLDYGQRLGKKWTLRLHPGLSFMNYHLNNDDATRFFSLRLNTSLTYRLAQQQALSWHVNIGNETPEISTHNKVDQDIDFLQVKRGNPDLDNTKLYNTAIVYNAQAGNLNFTLVGVYTLMKNNIFDDYYIEGEKLINSYSSDGDLQKAAGIFSAAWKITDNLRAKLDAQYMHYMISGKRETDKGWFNGGLTVNYFWKDFGLNLYGKTPKRSYTNALVEIKDPVKYGLSLSWNHQGWTLEAGTENLFTKHNYSKAIINSEVYNCNQINYIKPNQQFGYLKIAYTFDFGKKTSRDWKNVDTNINSAIMKAE